MTSRRTVPANKHVHVRVPSFSIHMDVIRVTGWILFLFFASFQPRWAVLASLSFQPHTQPIYYKSLTAAPNEN